MGKYDLAIRFGKSFIVDTASYVKACGKRSIIETKPTIFHGINPTLTYVPSGKTFTLPRFCTEEMKQARQMNKIAARQAKAGIVVRKYPKATPQDLKRLTSETIEDSYSRVEWTNPKDGKVYNLLKQGETEDGKVIVRILDEEGAFVKEAEIVPKSIAIIDDFYENQYINSISHGVYVNSFAQRHNPFARYTLINASDGEVEIWAEQLLKAVREIKDKRFDYISISSAKGSYRGNICSQEELVIELNNLIHKKGTRVLMASGNVGKDNVNLWLNGQIEGVGSLSKKGKVSEFSASRDSRFTQHYEVGEYNENFVYNESGEIIGLNITGKPGCDYKFKSRVESKDEIQKLEQQKLHLEHQIDEINNQIRAIQKKYGLISNNPELNSKYITWSNLNKELKMMCRRIAGTRCYKLEENVNGTSFSTPVRTAKLALNDMMESVL